MAVPRHLKVVIRGIFANTPEIWSYSLRFDRTLWGEGDAHAEDMSSSGMTAALAALHNTSSFSNGCKVTGWRAYDIGSDGRMEGNPKVVEFAPANYIAGTSANLLPPQVSLAVTTEAVNRGPARLGRFYLPGPSKICDSSYRLAVADQTVYCNLATQFYKDVADSVDVDFSVTGVEAINVSNIGSGHQQVISKIKVGRVYDTLRSRRGALLEEYVSSGVIDW